MSSNHTSHTKIIVACVLCCYKIGVLLFFVNFFGDSLSPVFRNSHCGIRISWIEEHFGKVV
jgi:hypothetical protein